MTKPAFYYIIKMILIIFKRMKSVKTKQKPAKNAARFIWLTIGCISLALGTIGIVLPLLPTVPFYMLTLFCFAKGSARLHRWFIRSGLYKKHMADFVERRAMPLKTKLSVMAAVTVMMGAAIWAMQAVPWAQALVGAVWTVHVLYFIFGIKTAE